MNWRVVFGGLGIVAVLLTLSVGMAWLGDTYPRTTFAVCVAFLVSMCLVAGRVSRHD